MANQGKSKIIDTAFYLFLQNGYQGTSIQDIMSAAGMSKGAIYHHFKSKHEIYSAVVEQFFFKQIELVKSDDASLHFSERIKNRYEIFCQICDYVEKCVPGGIEFPLRAYFIFQLESERDSIIYSRIVQKMAEQRAEIISIVQLAKDKGEIHKDLEPSVIAYQLISMIEGVAIHYSTVRAECAVFLRTKFQTILDPYLNMITKSHTLAIEPQTERYEKLG